ncbi:MAG: serine hydrolase, partial [Pseudomonadota bacterium]
MIRSVKMAAVCLGLAGFSYTGTAQERERDATLSAEEDQNQLRIRSEQVVDLINGEIEPDAILSEAFLQALPVPQVKAFSNSLTSQYGQAVAVETFNPIGDTRAVLDVRFERAIARGGIEIAPDEDNRISGLRFTSIDPVATDDDSAEKISAELNALPGEVSAYFGPIGQDGTAPAISIQPDKQMPLGSAFKLYVLATLAQDIAEGTRSWSDVVELQSKSFPSGRMQDWPQGSPTTLHTLAVMMISISDNTATDELVRVLGRDRILEVMAETGHPSPELNDPFMTTRELFLLKG